MKEKQEIAYKSVKDLIPYVNNTRTHDEKQVKQIAASIKEFGFTNPVLVGESNDVIAGHGRILAAEKLGIDEVPTIELKGLSEAQKKAYIIADNKLALNAGWDEELLKLEIENLKELDFDIDLLGFNDAELDDILKLDTTESAGEVVEDEFEGEPPENPISKRGDIWLLGRHRLMCGDSISDDVDTLMNGEKADIAFSSPPYNAGTTATETAMGKTTKYNGNDDNKSEAEYIDFLNAYIEQAIEHSEYVFMNVQSISNNKLALIDVLYHNRAIYADTIIWDKIHGQPAMAENVMNSVFEYVHIFSRKANRAVGTVQFRGTIDNILHLQSQRKNEYSDIHNATFSVEFASHFIRNFAKEGVLDQFGGTGTSLIACEQLNRICYMMELDEKYVDVIVNRYISFKESDEDVYLLRDGEKIAYSDIKEGD